MNNRPTASEKSELRRGWTTGACATAATKAAFELLVTGTAPDPVEITLPKGETPAFALATEERGDGWARAGIVKDAGDDPDVTHGALIVSTVRHHGMSGAGLRFVAGDGVGTISKAGLPLPPGEPAINPVPRQMMTAAIAEAAARLGTSVDVEIEISVPGGDQLAEKTWNPRLGIIGGISILGTTGIVHPFSCSAWIHSIHRGIDVARASGLERIAGATGSTSEAVAQAHYGLPDFAMIDMGDFAGGMLKYLRSHPVPRVTIAGGFAKMCKLAQGFLDLHSARSQVDFAWLAARAGEAGASKQTCSNVLVANTAAEVLDICRAAGIDIAADIASRCRSQAQAVLRDAPLHVEILIIDRSGAIIAKAGQHNDD
ncbi:MAG: cobalt-precorrin-5B (C(1))-methyltransferase [Hyphomicrobiaceae bacterium]